MDLFIIAQNYRHLMLRVVAIIDQHTRNQNILYRVSFRAWPGYGQQGVKMLTSDIQISRLWDL